MMTCSTSAGSIPARATALRIASPPSVVAESAASAPPRRPNGVRAVERTTVVHSPSYIPGVETGSLDRGSTCVQTMRSSSSHDSHSNWIVTCAMPNSSCIAAVIRLQDRGRFAQAAVVEHDVRRERVRA